jgi:hypothetical protein
MRTTVWQCCKVAVRDKAAAISQKRNLPTIYPHSVLPAILPPLLQSGRSQVMGPSLRARLP